MIVLQVMFSRGLGGLERAYLDHATLLAARGHRVHCLVYDDAQSRAELDRLAAERGAQLQVHTLAGRGWARLLLSLRLRKLLRGLQPDVIVAHGAMTVSRLAPLRSGPVPLVGITHNSSPRLMKATHLLALTQEMQRLFQDRGFAPARIQRMPNALPARFAALAPQPDRPLHQPLTIGVLARLVQKKGIDIFLRGLRLAIDQGLQAKALVGGDGPLREELEQLRRELRLEQHLEFLGWIADSRQFYSDIDLLCIPSRDEPFGIVVLEGFAQGTPVLAAAVGGPRELIEDGVSGGLFAPDDPQALAQALLRYANDAQRFPSIRAAAYAQLPQYRPEAVGARLEHCLQAAIADLRGGKTE